MAACAAPLVGWLARVGFGYEGSAEVGPDRGANLAKATSLSSALLVFAALPWELCTLLFTPLHWTYPRDRRLAEVAAAEAAAAAEALLAERREGVELAVVLESEAAPGQPVAVRPGSHEKAAAAMEEDSALLEAEP